MADRATPNLPSRDYETTATSFAALGFECTYRDEGCLRLDDVDGFVQECVHARVPEASPGWPRVHRAVSEDSPRRSAGRRRVRRAPQPNRT